MLSTMVKTEWLAGLLLEWVVTYVIDELTFKQKSEWPEGLVFLRYGGRHFRKRTNCANALKWEWFRPNVADVLGPGKKSPAPRQWHWRVTYLFHTLHHVAFSLYGLIAFFVISINDFCLGLIEAPSCFILLYTNN
jgi:hypothetical protein